jgi:hypothetical protein
VPWKFGGNTAILIKTAQNGFVHVEMHRGIQKTHPFRVLISAEVQALLVTKFSLAKDSRSEKRSSTLEVWGKHRYLG